MVNDVDNDTMNRIVRSCIFGSHLKSDHIDELITFVYVLFPNTFYWSSSF